MGICKGWQHTCDITGDAARVGDVMDTGPSLVLLVHRIEADEVFLCMTRHLSKRKHTA